MKVNSAWKCFFKIYTRSIALGVGPVQIWQQGYHSNACHFILMFRLTLGRPFHYFLVLSLLNLRIYFFIVNVIKYYLMAYLHFRELHFKIYYGVLNLSWVFVQIYTSLAVLLLVCFINPLIVHLFLSINSIHACMFSSPI